MQMIADDENLYVSDGSNPSVVWRWDGAQWHELNDLPIAWVQDMLLSGGELYLVGPDAINQSIVARWDGTEWAEIAAPVETRQLFLSYEAKLSAFQNAIYLAVTDSEVADGDGLYRLDDTTWTKVNGLRRLKLLAGSPQCLYQIRQPQNPYQRTLLHCFNGATDQSRDLDARQPTDVAALAVRDGIPYVAGYTNEPGRPFMNAAAWFNGDWQILWDTTLASSVNSIDIDRQGRVYLSGYDLLPTSGGSVHPILRLDGADWVPVATQVGSVIDVSDSLIDGDAIYLVGTTTDPGNRPRPSVAVWDGTAWTVHKFGPATSDPYYIERISRIISYDGAIYVVRDLDYIIGPGPDTLARFDGENLEPVATFNNEVHALAAGPDGLYIAGDFTDDAAAPYLSRWDGETLRPVAVVDGPVHSLAFQGSRLYIGGAFSEVNSTRANNVARWNGREWQALGAGTNGPVSQIAIEGIAVYLSGRFSMAGDVPSSGFAIWRETPTFTQQLFVPLAVREALDGATMESRRAAAFKPSLLKQAH